MEPLGVASGRPKQSRHGIFGNVDQAGSSAHPASFAEMIDDGRRLFLRDLRIEQGRATSLGELLAARPAAQEPDTVLAVDFAHGEIGLACVLKLLACGVHTR
jgi:hypothetical protein